MKKSILWLLWISILTAGYCTKSEAQSTSQKEATDLTYEFITEIRTDVEIDIQEDVRGQVVDAQTGEPLPGVNVFIQGTTTGTATDLDGRYQLTIPSLNEVLIFSFIGYQRIEEPTNGRTEINIELQSVAILADDIIVTALGIDRQARSLGYSIARANNADVALNRTTNFMDALQGKMAGVNITSPGSGPQGSSKVRIRGQSSFGANNSPLIVVNGVPIDNTTFGVNGDFNERGSNRNSDGGDGLSSINSDDIVDITVLKGGAAAALYGSRAKDGVIMITTRQRAAGLGTQVVYNSNFQVARAIDRRNYQMEYGQGEGGVRPTSPNPGSGVWSFGEKFEPGMTQILFNGVEVPYQAQPNQLREYYRNGIDLSNTITLSHGGETGGFNLSLGNLTSTAILPGSSFDRNNLTLGFTQRVADRLTLSGNVNYTNEVRTNPPNTTEQDFSPVVIYTLANSMPMSVLKENAFTEDGNEAFWSRFTNRTNPYVALTRFENNDRDRIFGNVTANYVLLDWLSVQGRIGQDYYYREQEYNLPHGTVRQAPAPPGFINGQYVKDQLSSREINADFLILANQQLTNDFAIDGILGGNTMYRRSERLNVLVQDFFARDLYSIGNGRLVDPQSNFSERQVNSIYGSAELSFRSLLFVTGTLRNDWFSTLSPDNRSILYPSFTTSVVFSEAFESAMPNWLSYGRVYGAYSEVGSDTDVPPFAGNLNYNINPFLFEGNARGGISGNQVPNPNLRPMRVIEWEFGFEVNVFNNVSLEFSYYNKLSQDQILQQQISSASGFTTQLINIGESQNRGVEMMLDFFPIQSDNFTWNTNVNAAYNITKVLDLGSEIGVDQMQVGGGNRGALRQVTGLPMNQIFGFGWLRDDQGRRVFNPNNGMPLRTASAMSFGGTIPTWIGGINNRMNLGNFSMTFLIDFTLGHKMFSHTYFDSYRHGLDKATLVGREQGFVVGDGVNPDGTVNTAQAPVQGFYESINTLSVTEQSVFNAGSWQLRQISVGYDMTRHVASLLGLRGLTLSLIANNVAVLKSWVPHIHPEQSARMSDRQSGMENTGLPPTTNIGFNLNVQI